MFQILKEYFNLSNTEQKGIISLILIILFVFIGTQIFFMFQPTAEIPQDNTELLAQFYKDSTSSHSYTTKKNYDNNEKSNLTNKIIYFNFDPNTSSKENLISLGFTEKTANILINFRNKGGKFYKKEDLKKVYGVNEELYNSLKAYIFIPKKEYKKKEYYIETSNKEEKEYHTYNKNKLEKNTYPPVIVNINMADSATLTTVKGIGKTYASRIIKFRNLLGGFHNKTQLKEVYGINEEVYAEIQDQVEVVGAIKTLNINTATWAELNKHPYIKSDMANIITKYIKANGQINDLDKILNPSIFDEITIQKIKPYLRIE